MVEVELRNRHGEHVGTALLDDIDAELVDHRWVWTHGYARRNVQVGSRRQKAYSMHRDVAERMGIAFAPMVDHKNGNTLDNRRANLRPATHALNMQNLRLSTVNRSGYRGVYWDGERSKWVAQVRLNGRRVRLGRFDLVEDAARAASEWRAVNMPYAVETVVSGQ